MEFWQIITVLPLGIITAALFIISYRQSKEKGFIFTNTWFYAAKKERENMDENIKKAEYRLGRNVFFLLSIMSLLMTVYILTLFAWFLYSAFIVLAFTAIYAVVQYIKSEKSQRI